MANTIKYYMLIFFLVVACGDDDSGGLPGLPEGTLEKRTEYQVTTLTESFDGSGGISVSDDGFIYVADFGDQLNNADGTTVKKVDPISGEITLFAEGLRGASGNDFGPDGYLYQSNIAGNSVSKISPAGEVISFASNNIQGPVGVVTDPQGNVFVCNCGGNSITRISSEGEATILLQNNNLFNCPNGITRDDLGNLYVVNFRSTKVIKVLPDGSASEFTKVPSTAGHITFANGELYVVGRTANQIYSVDLSGEVSVIAGKGERGNEDGDFFYAKWHQSEP